MNDPSEWIRNLIPQEQVEQLEASSKRIVNGDTTYHEMSIVMSEADMITAVQNMYKMQDGDVVAWMFGIDMLVALISSMETALQQSGVDYKEGM